MDCHEVQWVNSVRMLCELALEMIRTRRATFIAYNGSENYWSCLKKSDATVADCYWRLTEEGVELVNQENQSRSKSTMCHIKYKDTPLSVCLSCNLRQHFCSGVLCFISILKMQWNEG